MTRPSVFKALLFVVGVLSSAPALADGSIIRNAGQHDSSVEVEVHGVARWHNRGRLYGSGAVGAGLRVGIPIVENGFVRSINNQVNINFGGDLILWPSGDGYVSLVAPVALQWSFFLHRDWSVFGEAGLALEFFPSGEGVGASRNLWVGVWPGMAVGGRYHLNGNASFPALTLRLGFPSGINFGVSF